jgi:hypothetical protein
LFKALRSAGAADGIRLVLLILEDGDRFSSTEIVSMRTFAACGMHRRFLRWNNKRHLFETRNARSI